MSRQDQQRCFEYGAKRLQTDRRLRMAGPGVSAGGRHGNATR
ncbi:hypothetical protein [Actinomadura sp. NTSP31]